MKRFLYGVLLGFYRVFTGFWNGTEKSTRGERVKVRRHRDSDRCSHGAGLSFGKISIYFPIFFLCVRFCFLSFISLFFFGGGGLFPFACDRFLFESRGRRFRFGSFSPHFLFVFFLNFVPRRRALFSCSRDSFFLFLFKNFRAVGVPRIRSNIRKRFLFLCCCFFLSSFSSFQFISTMETG